MDPDNLVLVLYEKFSGDMEISVGNKYRFKCYQFLEYPVVLVVFHLPKNFWTALYILIKGTGYVFILPAVFWSKCTLKHDCTRPYVYFKLYSLCGILLSSLLNVHLPVCHSTFIYYSFTR